MKNTAISPIKSIPRYRHHPCPIRQIKDTETSVNRARSGILFLHYQLKMNDLH